VAAVTSGVRSCSGLLSLGCEVHTLDLAEAAPDPRAAHTAADLRDYDAIARAFEGVRYGLPHGGAHLPPSRPTRPSPGFGGWSTP
jgi:hypothetical protein